MRAYPTFLTFDVGVIPNMHRRVYYTEAMAVPIWLTGIHANFGENTPTLFSFALTDTEETPTWSPEQSPATVALGQFTQAQPVMPFGTPYLLKPGHVLKLDLANDDFIGTNVDFRIVVAGARMLSN
jgi:hypothetical protein